jgi:hypothetical protein
MNKQIYTVNDPFFVQGPIFDQQVDLMAFLPHPSNNFITFYSHFLVFLSFSLLNQESFI